MAFKRTLGVLTVEHGRLVKSYGYTGRRPSGGLVTALQNLDRWAVDEIVVLDISRRAGLDPAVLAQIEQADISTPLAYGGGIRTNADVAHLMELGCDRFVVESLLFEDAAALAKIAGLAGRQALIGSVPVRSGAAGLELWRPSGWQPLERWRAHLMSLPVSEFFVTAVEAEGRAGAFPRELPAALAWLGEASVIWFGGLDTAAALECLRVATTAAVAFGNPNYEKELALPMLRESALRSPATAAVRTVRLG